MGKIISIGWDVGGWHGNKNAVCALGYSSGKVSILHEPQLLDKDELFDESRDLPTFIKRHINSDCKVILAIDSPLGFPIKFTELVSSGADLTLKIEDDYFKNPYAFRETDMHIKEQLGKKPISPTFDKLTNNVTIALTMKKIVSNQGFKVYPFDNNNPSDRNIAIEVYPGIFKLKKNLSILKMFLEILEDQLSSLLRSSLNYYLEDYKDAKTDQGDALVCSILGLCFALDGVSGFPKISNIPKESMNLAAKEGWIYYPQS